MYTPLMRLILAVALLLPGVALPRALAQGTFTDPGFVADTVVRFPPFTAVGIAFAPDGRLFLWEKRGVVRVFKHGALLATPFIDLSSQVNQVLDRGLLGVALDANFAANGTVYLLYTFEEGGNPNDPGPKTARLTRVTADPSNPDVALPDSEVVLLGGIGLPPCDRYPPGADCMPADELSHTIGTVRVAPDGTLFVGNGDGAFFGLANALALRAQDLDSYAGKLLRITPDGSAPGDNPFDDGTPSVRSKVWAYGLRNPFRFALDPQTGEPYIGDVGWNAWERVVRGRGANFGWPCYEGNAPQPEYQAAFVACQHLPASAVMLPLYTYPTPPGAAVIGGAFVQGEQYPEPYRGNFFFGDSVRGWINRMVLDANGHVLQVLPFAEHLPGPVDIELGPDGFLYYVAFLSGEVGRIRFSGPNAKASASPTAGYAPLDVAFSSGGSQDPLGGGLAYRWDFGDGGTSPDPNPAHTYVATGVVTFPATLTVTDRNGLSASATVPITLGSLPPVATIGVPAAGTPVRAGETVFYQGVATDLDEGRLPPTALSWTILLHHNDHVHRFVGGTGASGSFVVQHHDAAATYAYEVVLTATDSSGLTATTSVVLPVTSPAPPTAPGSPHTVHLSGTGTLLTPQPTTTALTASAATLTVGTSLTLTAIVTAAGGATLTGTVTFASGGTVLGTGPVTNGMATYSTPALAVGTYALTATYSGDTTSAASTAPPITVAVVAFQLALSTSSLSVAAGQSAQVTLTLTPGPALHEPVSFSCMGLPLAATCSFDPASVTPIGAALTTTMTITTTAPAGRSAQSLGGRGSGPFSILLIPGVMGLVVAGHRKQGWRSTHLLGLVLLLAFVTLWLPACGGEGANNSGTPAGTSTVTVTAATTGSTPLSYQVPITLIVMP